MFLDKKQKLKNISLLLNQKLKIDENLIKFFEKNNENPPKNSISLKECIKRPNIDAFKINQKFGVFKDFDYEVINEINLITKYEGYLKQQEEDIEKLKKMESQTIPEDFDYTKQKGLKIETIQKLTEVKPINLGQASRVSGVSPADIAVLGILVKKHKEAKNAERRDH